MSKTSVGQEAIREMEAACRSRMDAHIGRSSLALFTQLYLHSHSSQIRTRLGVERLPTQWRTERLGSLGRRGSRLTGALLNK